MKQIFVGSVIRAKLYSEIKKEVAVPHILQATFIFLLIVVPLALQDKIFHVADGEYSNIVYVETPSGIGSAIYIGNQYLLTAAHVVGDESIVQVEFQDPNSSPIKKSPMKYDANVVAVGNYKSQDDFEEDYALLKLLYVDGSSYAKPCVLGDSKNVKVGDKIKVEGYPGGDHFLTEGTINNINGGDTKSVGVFVVDAGTWPGNSGGALKNQNDELIGLVTMKGVGAVNIGRTYVIKINDIRTKLKAYGLPF